MVQVLESDPEFRKKLETADVEKIRDGSIANELEMVNHQVRGHPLMTSHKFGDFLKPSLAMSYNHSVAKVVTPPHAPLL